MPGKVKRRTDWNRLPDELQYLQPFAERFGKPQYVLLEEFQKQLQTIDTQTRSQLEECYRKLIELRHMRVLIQWLQSEGSDERRDGTAGYVLRLFNLLDEMGIGELPDWESSTAKPKDTVLPVKFDYLLPLITRHGDWKDDSALEEYILSLNDDDLNDLAQVAERIRLQHHGKPLNRWLRRNPIAPGALSSRVYQVLLLLDALDLPVE